MQIRSTTLLVSFLAGILWVGLLSLLLPADPRSFAGDLLLDRSTTTFVYPFTIQNVMWLIFFVAAGDLAVRHLAAIGEEEQLRLGLLPEDDETVLRQQDIGPIYRRVRQTDPDRRYWMQRLLTGALLQFQSSGSIDQVNAMLNSSMELYQHEIELRYNTLRYLVWLIPTLGFNRYRCGHRGGVADGWRDVCRGPLEHRYGRLGTADDDDPDRRTRRGILHDAARVAAVGRADVCAAHGAGKRGRVAQPGRPVFSQEPGQSPLRTAVVG